MWLIAVPEKPPPRLNDLTWRGSVVHEAFHTLRNSSFCSDIVFLLLTLCKEYSQINPANNARFPAIIQCIVVFYNKDQVNHVVMLAFTF